MRLRRGGQIVRQWQVLLALSDREWYTIDQIRDSIPAPRPHRRTIMRDLEILTQVFQIDQRGGGSGASEQHRFEYHLRTRLRASIRKLAR